MSKVFPKLIVYNYDQNDFSLSDVTKYVISKDAKRLTVMNVDKATDILCVQCSVENDYGTVWGDGCLTVICELMRKHRGLEVWENWDFKLTVPGLLITWE